MLYINGFGYVWENQYVEHENEFLASSTQRLKDQFLQEWSDNIQNSSKLVLYKQFKLSFCYEHYLDIVTVRKFRNALATFRSGRLGIEIERGRYLRIPRHERICKVCPKRKIEDEYHFCSYALPIMKYDRHSFQQNFMPNPININFLS